MADLTVTTNRVVYLTKGSWNGIFLRLDEAMAVVEAKAKEVHGDKLERLEYWRKSQVPKSGSPGTVLDTWQALMVTVDGNGVMASSVLMIKAVPIGELSTYSW